LEAYQTQAVSIHVLGGAFHRNAFEGVMLLALADQVGIKCCEGSSNEVSAALGVLSAGNTIVVDLTALATLASLNLTNILESFPGKFAVSTGTVNELREMIATTSHASGDTGYAGKSEEGFYMISETEADRKQRIESLRSLVGTIEKGCKILSGLELAAVEKQSRDFMIRGFGQHGAESLVIAAQSGHVIWTDDIVMAAYGGMRLGTRRVWSQIVLQWLAQSGGLSDLDFYKATAKLFGWRYYFTAISSPSLEEAAKLAEWQATRWPLRQCIEVFGYENVDLYSLFDLGLGFLASVYANCEIPESRSAITTAVVERLSSRTSGSQAVEALVRMIPVRFGLNVIGAQEARSTIDTWMKARMISVAARK
jgi:hypothetical protein